MAETTVSPAASPARLRRNRSRAQPSAEPVSVPESPTVSAGRADESPTTDEDVSSPASNTVEDNLPTQPSTVSEPTRSTDTEQVEEFLREVDLADGTRLDLGGIAWSETGPFALINGQVLGQGESVEGFAIVEILPKSVLLKGGDRSILLRLR